MVFSLANTRSIVLIYSFMEMTDIDINVEVYYVASNFKIKNDQETLGIPVCSPEDY